ncbi:MAG: hypothetical protein ACT4OQ_04330 [Chloroflexota bacterium]
MSGDVDDAVHAHLARMPDSTRRLLEPHITADAADAWLRDALMAYLRYFVRVFDRDETRAAAESQLAADLNSVTNGAPSGDEDADITAAEAQLAPDFATRGFRFLGGRTPPYLGAYIWSRTEDRRFTVVLPRGQPEEVTVHFCHDFLIRGWLHWQTFAEQGAGGWYQQDNPDWPDGLYCVAERYPEPLEQNRSFQVSLLGHEAQHVADHRAHPGLSSSELEYRAKLVELIGFDTVADRLRFFLADAANDPEQPHPYAAHLIVSRLAARLFDGAMGGAEWDAVPYAEIRRHATALFDEDTARLTGSG